MSEKKILITGSGGFVGTSLTSFLTGKYHLTGVDLPDKGSPTLDESYTWDELDYLKSYDTIIHLAGKAHDIYNKSVKQEYFDVNLGLTQKIFAFFIRSESRKFILFSSVKAVADSLDGKILTEEFIPIPKTPYGESKLAAEKHVLIRNKIENKKIFVLRPCLIHGHGSKGNINALYEYTRKGFPYPFGAFENLRSFLSIQNLNYLVLNMIEKPLAPGIYNVADDDPVSTNEIIELIAETLDIKPWIWKLPKSFVSSAAKIGDLAYLPVNSERIRKLTESYIVSNLKLKKALGIYKLPVLSRDGLLRTFENMAK